MVLQLNGVRKLYGGVIALDNCSLELGGGEVIALLGPNGSGKTTLLKLMCGLIRPTAGELHLKGKAPRDGRAEVAYSSDAEDLYAWMSPALAKKFMSAMFTTFDGQKFDELCRVLEVPLKKFSEMSKGERRRFKLALTMSRRAKFYLLDEPLSGIDIIAREKILKGVLHGWNKESTLILSTHEFEGAQGLFSRVLLLKRGAIVGDLSAQGIEAQGKSIVDVYKETFQ